MRKHGDSLGNDEPLFLLKLTSTRCFLEIPSPRFLQFSALRDSLVEPTQTSFSALAGPPPPSPSTIPPIRKLHVRDTGLWIAQLLFSQSGERFKWNAPILDIWVLGWGKIESVLRAM